MRKKITAICIACLLVIVLSGITGCGGSSSNVQVNSGTEAGSSETGAEHTDSNNKDANISGGSIELENGKLSSDLTYSRSTETEYAEKFRIDRYMDAEGREYTLLQTVPDDTLLLIVPEEGSIPKDLDASIVVLQRPVENLYLVASAAMDMFVELDALDSIRFSGQKQENWYIAEASQAMQDGKILYAGKYSKPDYEMIVSNGCSLAIENTMIFHSPDVIEQLGNFGVPVVVDYSSTEDHPLGRVEWIKFYGALTGCEEAALEIYEKEADMMEAVESGEKSNLTVAYFYITSNNLVQVRKSSDYIPKMIEIAGGKYIFDNLTDDTNKSTVNMQLEEFYDKAKDSDVLIYNSSIDGGVESIDELIGKWELLKDFKAVKEGNVWCTTNDMYQQSLSIGYMTEDIHAILGGNEEGLHYIYKLQ
ncbi:MAG: ABC transporter substrate-binding protein [Lachnospiraceae bacterium]|nr:ABC transporter substrate-binding protein [Lachnospiraceae bacterium]